MFVNGKQAGYIAHAPWQCNVTKWIKRGNNTIEVVVIGTLKNTLGPHHGKAAYSTVGYGLFELVELRELR